MSDLAMNLVRGAEPHPSPGGVPVFRTLLAGGFSAADSGGRSILEALLRTPSTLRAHRVLPGHRDRDLDEHAEDQLAGNAVDIVLLDLDGPLLSVLSLIGRLRAAASAGVVFIGVLPRQVSAEACLYLAAALDAVVDGARAVTLHRAIAEAFEVAADFADAGYGPIAAGSATRH